MRLFVAVELDLAVARAMADLGEQLRRRAETRAPRARITWIPADRLHLTLRFIGEVDERRADAIRAVLDPPVAVDAFDLTLSGLGAFPNSGPPRVLWAGLSAGEDALIRLEEEVSARLARCGVEPENRPYRPHLTLARVREAAGLRAGPLLEGLGARASGTSRVDAITLFESRLSPKGPTYVALQRTPLRGPT
ncbi:MAG: RNA 2',3'-cyclic phosphodiesterase [Acidobacteria bacterium]|nr:RNA 2',3'-cyclic phosphodiesterase [Acidobacteriota bacterium]